MLSKNEIDYLLYSIPNNVDYTTIIEDIDLEDIPKDRVEKLINILNNESKYDFWVVFRAGGLLCHWGIYDGLIYMYRLLFNSELAIHKDFTVDEYKYILSAIQSYMVSVIGKENECEFKDILYFSVNRIVEYAKEIPFSISGLYYLVMERYSEYIPIIKEYFAHIATKPEHNYWSIYDCAKFLLKIDREFVEYVLKNNNMTLAKFNLT